MNHLIDRFGRKHDYLRISVTDRCNLRCRYCMPFEGIRLKPRDEILTFDEIETLARIFVDLGIKKIRITGGEPLVRTGVEELCARLAKISGLETLALSTNGVFLEKKASRLRRAGVSQLNISLDTLRAERFQHITFRTHHEEVLRGIEQALELDFDSVKINTVIMKGFNDDELLDFVEFAIALALNLRFIEYMPFWGNGWSDVQFLSYHEMRRIIETNYTLIPTQHTGGVCGPATEFRVEGTKAIIGFIPTMSQPFCNTCNRLRLTADGKLRNCLFAREDYDLKRRLRAGASTEVIQDMIRAAVILKWKQHPEADELIQMQNNVMVAIGG